MNRRGFRHRAGPIGPPKDFRSLLVVLSNILLRKTGAEGDNLKWDSLFSGTGSSLGINFFYMWLSMMEATKLKHSKTTMAGERAHLQSKGKGGFSEITAV